MRLDAAKSPYGPLHAIAVGAALVYLMVVRPFAYVGFQAFWHAFVYGVKLPPDVAVIKAALAGSVMAFGGVGAVAWLSTLFARRAAEEGVRPECDRLAGLRFAMRCVAPITVVTIAVNMACSAALKGLTGVELADQSLVELLRGDGAAAVKALVALLAVVEAPLLEEPLFRGIVFRGFARVMPFSAAAVLSGFLFALVHVNAATFIPLWFLGAAFAWMYWRTGTILAPMAAHCVFNLANLCIALLVPSA